MSFFSRFLERIRRVFRRKAPETEIEIPQPEIPIIPPIAPEPKEEPIAPPVEEEKEVEIPEEIQERQVPEERLSKVVTFEERMRGTRIKRTMSRSYPIDTSDGDIQRILNGQYDAGGNYVINVKSIEIKSGIEYEEEEIERGNPGSADVSP